MSMWDRFSAGLAKSRAALARGFQALTGVAGVPRLDSLDELEAALIGADVGAKMADRFLDDIRRGIAARELKTPDDIRNRLKASVKACCTGAPSLATGPHPLVVLFVGINGVGKTTTIAKLAARYRADGRTVLLAAGDTFRAAAIEQLQVWGERLGSDVIHQRAGSDPAAVAFDAVSAAVARGVDVLLIDSAGRLHTKHSLMEELLKVKRVIGKALSGAPHEVLLVLDASTGQNALAQARTFQETLGVTGIALTKLDGTAKGGIVLAIVSELGIPVKLVGLGEDVDALVPFDADAFAEGLVGGSS